MINSPLSALTAWRAKAIRKTIIDLRYVVAEQQVNNTLNTKNSLTITETLSLAPGSNIKV
jgi:hypothetical protein